MRDTLRQEFRTLDVGPKALRSFGLLVGTVLLGLAAWVGWRSGAGALAYGLGVGGGGLIGLGLAAPGVLRPLYRVWMALALVLGYVMTRVLLTLVFFLAVTPIGLVMRLLGKDPMHRRPDPKRPTYWRPHPPRSDNPERLRKYY